jgi:hypothetical protein
MLVIVNNTLTCCSLFADWVTQGQGWVCAGLKVKFDRPILIRNSYGGQYGARHGFELWNNITGNPVLGGTSAGSRQLTCASKATVLLSPRGMMQLLAATMVTGCCAPPWLCSSNLCTDCAKCPCWQPLEFSVVDSHTVQLNTTYISGAAASHLATISVLLCLALTHPPRFLLMPHTAVDVT